MPGVITMTTNTLYILFGISMLSLIMGFVVLLMKKVPYIDRNSNVSTEMFVEPKETPLWKTNIPSIVLVLMGVSGLSFTSIGKLSAKDSTNISDEPFEVIMHSNDNPRQTLADLTRRLEDELKKQFEGRIVILTPDYERFTITLQINDRIPLGIDDPTPSNLASSHRLSAQISLRARKDGKEGESKRMLIQPVYFLDISRLEPGQDLYWYESDEHKVGEFQNEVRKALQSIKPINPIL